MEDKISEMTEKEILRQQLELLAKESQNCIPGELALITNSMVEIYDRLVS